MRRGPTPGSIFELENEEITIGRGNKNTIVIRDNEVSREHCRLVRRGDDYEVVDGGSSNGTFVNGQRVLTTWALRNGTLIELGDSVTLEYERINLPVNAQRILNGTDKIAKDAPAKHYLTITAGPHIGHVYPLEDIIITVGRETSNDIHILDTEVSRYHLRLRREKRGFSAEDMGSTNGTTLNGIPLTEPTLLENNDLLRLGTMVELQYLRQTAETDTSPLEDDTGGVPVQTPEAPILETLHVPMKGKSSRNLGTGLESGMLADHLFLAYDRRDWETVAAPLMLALQDAGVKVWVDQYLTYESDSWRKAVEQAARECRVMIIVVSPNSMVNPQLKHLYRQFVAMNKPIVPLLYESTALFTGGLHQARPVIYTPHDPLTAAGAVRDAIARYR
jgi:pSer/pThr/pTyr-binding forkhead associated (FHA) protein